MSQDELGREHVIALVFGLLGVIQGLAFTKLAEKMPKTFSSKEFSFQNFGNIIYFLIAFLIVARVFQTYASGAVTYAQPHMKIIDLYGVFIAGLLQYWVFDAFKNDGEIDKENLFRRVMYLSILAFCLHLIIFVKEIKVGAETNIQEWNMIFASGIFFCCFAANWVKKELFNIVMAAIISFLLFTNTWNSINNTDFGAKPENFEGQK